MKTEETNQIYRLVYRNLFKALLMLTIVLTGTLMLSVKVLAANEGEPTRTTPLKLAEETEAKGDSDEGWQWEPDANANGGTLTLRNFYLKSSEVEALTLRGDVKIVLYGKNTIETTSDRFNAMIDDGNSGNLNLTISAGDPDGSLDILCPDSSVSSEYHPYGIAADSIAVTSGTIYVNTDFCIVGNRIDISGGSLTVENQFKDGTGLYSAKGNINISGGSVNITVSGEGLTVGIYITTGFSEEDKNVVNITGGDVTVKSSSWAIYSPNTTINTDGNVTLYGEKICIASPKGNIKLLKGGTIFSLTNSADSQYGVLSPSQTTDKVNVIFGEANYTEVNEVLNEIPSDLSLYTEESVQALKEAQEAVIKGKNITEQDEVNTMAQAIENAIAALQYKDADYSKVDAAIEKANALKKDQFVSFEAVEAAINAVIEGKNITEQNEVDAMAQAIEDAIAALQYKDADYSKVDAAIAKAKALNKEDYKDFSAVEAAINAVERGKKISEQAEVDAMAQAIENAIAGLEKKETLTDPENPDKPTAPDEPTAPDKPTAPDEPSISDKPASSSNTEKAPQKTDDQTKSTGKVAVKTGDSSNPTVVIMLLLVSAAGIGSVMFFEKKKMRR